ncbi:hypothetical protein OQA88_4399 [Cercophora sp. LCS_1]
MHTQQALTVAAAERSPHRLTRKPGYSALGDGNNGEDEGAVKRGNFDLAATAADTASISHFVNLMRRSGFRDDFWDYWFTATAFLTRLSIAKFCVTARGYAGPVPKDAAVGDTIALVHGAAVPFVLRNRKREGATIVDTQTLVGECYIHGIVHGEALGSRGAIGQQFLLV